MKTIIPIALLLMLGFLAGCTTTTEETITPVAPTTTTTTQPGSSTTVVSTTTVVSATTTTPGSMTTTPVTGLQGTFVSNVHATSGTVRVTETGGKRMLVFTNFKTDGGPDLRIYLAENTGLRNFIEVSKLEKSGNFSVELPAEADPQKQRFVLIWCKPFSVLFGNAELK
jgi:hypothetical protein